MERIALLVACAALWITLSNPTHATSTPTVQQDHTLLHDLWLKVQKIEALVTLMQDDQKMLRDAIPVRSEPLTEQHLELPLKSISMTTVPGMEPAKEPVQSVPVARGHFETQYYGWRGRQSRQIWVSDSTPRQSYQYNYSSGGCSGGGCGRGGIF